MRTDATAPPLPSGGVPSTTAHVLGVMLLLAAGAQAAVFLYVLLRAMILRPFGDMVFWIAADLDLNRWTALPAYLWSPHNEHHMVLIRLLATLDTRVFHASGVPFVIAATLALLVTTWLLFRPVWLTPGPDTPGGGPTRALALLIPMLVLTVSAAVDCGIPINTVYPISLVFMVAALVLFEGEGAPTGAPTPGRRGMAILAAVLASFGNAVGLVVWPALLWSAWRGRAGTRWLAIVLTAGLAYGVLYIGTVPVEGIADRQTLFTLPHLTKMLDYLLLYLGLPLSRAPGLGVPARVLGAALLLAGLTVLARAAVGKRPSTSHARLQEGLILMALAAAALAAIGRVDLEPEVKIPVRYAILVMPAHVALLTMALSSLVRRAAPRVLPLCAGLGLAVALLVLQVMGGRAAIPVSDRIAAVIARYEAGMRDPAVDRVVIPNDAQADRVFEAIGRRVSPGLR